MAKLESSFKNMLIVLTSIAVVAGVGLASMNNATKGPISESAEKKSSEAIQMVLPESVVGVIDTIEIIVENGLKINKAYAADGSFIGAAVEGKSVGFSGDIVVMVGFDKEGAIIEYQVLKQTETPGLGTKMVNWFKPQVSDTSLVEKLFAFTVAPPKVNSSIIGLNPKENNLSVSKDGGEIDAITASTISSRAFLQAITSAYAAYSAANNVEIDTKTGATKEGKETHNE